MKSLRTMISILAGFVLAAVALPGFAGTKTFTSSASASGNTVGVYVQNDPSSISAINSLTFTLNVDVTNFQVPAALSNNKTKVSPNCTTQSPTTVCAAKTPITVTNISNMGPGVFGTFTMTGAYSTAANPACLTQDQLTVQAWTGNPAGGTLFTDSTSNTTTATDLFQYNSCHLAFYLQPANAQVNTVITSVAEDTTAAPVTVRVYASDNSLATGFSGQITLTKASVPGSGSGALTGGDPIVATGGSAQFTSLMIIPTGSQDAAGNYTLTAAGSGFASVNSNPFVIYDGVLNCDGQLDSGQTNPTGLSASQPGYAAGSRGKYNKDGSQCVKVGYNFTNSILSTSSPNTVHLVWDTGLQPNADFVYTMNWQLRSVDSTTGWTDVRPLVAWESDKYGIVGPVYVPGLACLGSSQPSPSSSLPSEYGTLLGDIDVSTSPISVTLIATLPPTPFPIVIGTERMQVTGLSGSNTVGSTVTLTVTRGAGGTGATSTTGLPHLNGSPAMSTPLPIDPNKYLPTPLYPANTANPYYQKQAHMCIAEHDWTSGGIDSNGNAMVMYSTTVYDIGDGFVTFR